MGNKYNIGDDVIFLGLNGKEMSGRIRGWDYGVREHVPEYEIDYWLDGCRYTLICVREENILRKV